MRIDVIVFDGFDELDAVGPYEVFGHAVRAGAAADVAYARLGGPGVVTASLGTRVEAQRALGDDADLVVVPGGGWFDDAAGAKREVARGELPAALAHLHVRGATVASVCTGGMILAASGLRAGRRAPAPHLALPLLADHGATPVPDRVVDEGSIVTAGAVTSGLDLALHLVARELGERYADAVADNMAHPRSRVVA